MPDIKRRITVGDVINKLKLAAPYESSWIKKEPWGEFNVSSALRNHHCKNILYCVTPTPEIQDHFRQGKYDLMVSHHPYIMKDIPQVILHTALDCCKGGLNDQWADMLGLKNPVHFDGTLGSYGEIDPIEFPELMKKVEGYVGQPILGNSYHDGQPIRDIVICTGLGGMVEHLANKTNADCYILGQHVGAPQESPFPCMIEVGHTLTEHRPGVEFVQKVLGPEVHVDHSLPKDYFSSGGHYEVFARSPSKPDEPFDDDEKDMISQMKEARGNVTSIHPTVRKKPALWTATPENPFCPDCGELLTYENSSKSPKTNVLTHTSCPYDK